MKRLILLLLVAGCASPFADVTVSSLELGAVEPHHTHRGTLRVTNVGATRARLLRVERQSGPLTVTVTPAQVHFSPGDVSTWNVAVEAGGVGPIDARFAAVFDTGISTFRVRAQVASPCEPQLVDIGDARVGASVSTRLVVENPLPYAAEVFLSTPGRPFSFEQTGRLRLAPGERRELSATFSPSHAGVIEQPWLAALRTDCTASTSVVRGRAVEAPLTFVPGRLHFGALPQGSSTRRSVEVKNATRSPLQLTALTSRSNQFVLVTPLPLEVPADGRATLEVEARSDGAGVQASTFTFATNAPAQAEVNLPLLVNFAGACVSWSPERIDVGAVELDCRGAEQRVTLRNACPHAVELSEAVLPEGFALISAAPRALAPGASETFTIVFSPRSEGPVSGALGVEANVFDGIERVAVPLEAVASARPRIEESYVVPEQDPRADVLIVLDDSPGMLALSTLVSRNLGDFAQYLESNEYDTRVAVMTTSTSPGVAGRLRKSASGSPYLATPTRDQLQALTQLTGQGTGRSSCLEALRTAFTTSLRSDPTELGGLLRPEVPLMVVCITNGRDELESSPMEAIAEIQSKLPRRHAIGVIARFVEPAPAGCSDAVDHGALRALAMMTDGVIDEVCTPNWAASFARVGRNAFGYATNVPLQQMPAFERQPLRVWLDAIEVPQQDPAFNSVIWRWHPTLNAVAFEPLYAPEPGRRVTLRYTPACPLP